MTRRPTPPAGIDDFSIEPDTGVIDDPAERAAVRSKRPTHERLARVETKQDQHAEGLRRVELAVEKVCGKLEAYVDSAKEAHATERVRIGTSAKTIAAIVGAIATIAAAYLAGSAGCA